MTGQVLSAYTYENLTTPDAEVIVIPDGITEVESCAFWSCIATKKIIIPTSVTQLNPWSIINCGCLEEVHYMGSQSEWDHYVKKTRNKGWLHNSGKPKITFEKN